MNWKWLFVGLLFTVTAAAAQQSTPHNMMATQDFIDGAKNPELIPDGTAWRLWLISVTAEDEQHPELQVARMRAFLRATAIQESDLPAAEQALAHFKADYAALIDSYNKRMNSGENISMSEFTLQRDALIQATQTSLLGKLSTTSSGRLKSHVVREKTRMKIAKEVQ